MNQKKRLQERFCIQRIIELELKLTNKQTHMKQLQSEKNLQLVAHSNL
jgi:hypothetical protein